MSRKNRKRRKQFMAKLSQNPGDSPTPADGQQQQRLAFHFTQAEFHGPIPPPSMLSDYNHLIPRGGERIMVMAENQTAHRQLLEKQVVMGNLASAKRGQFFGFTMGMTAIVGGLSLVWHGREISGLAAVIGAVAGLVSVFLIGRLKEKEERQAKVEALPPKLR